MRRNFFSSNSKQAGIIAKYYSPDIAFEQGLRSTVKCASIVEEHGKKLPLLSRVQVKFNVDAIFGNLLWRQINKSRCFCNHLTAWLFLHWRRLDDIKAKQLSCASHYVIELGKACSIHIQGKQRQNNSHSAVWKIYAFINIQPLTCLCIEPDLRWCKRLLVDLIEYMQLQDVMAWLSTLGGAYSAMGDHLYSHSEKACQISRHQLVVALRLKNPVLAAQCKVFVALSLIQRGQLKLASRIIRLVFTSDRVVVGVIIRNIEQYNPVQINRVVNGMEQYVLAKSDGFGMDEKLISSCTSAWSRIQYLKKQNKINRKAMKNVK